MTTSADLQRDMQALSNAIRTYVEIQSRAARSVDNDSNAFARQTAAVERHTETIVKGRKLNERQLKLLQDVEEAKRKEWKLSEELQKEYRKLQTAMRTYGQGHERTIAAQRRYDDLQSAHSKANKKLQKASTELEFSFRGLIKGVDVAAAALTWFGAAATNQVKQLVAQQRANSGVIEGSGNVVAAFANQQDMALKYALSAEQLSKITVPARQMFNALGGTAKGLDMLAPTIDRFRIMTGSSEEGMKLATEAAQNFAKVGIKPTTKGLQNFTKDVVEMQMRTGQSTEQVLGYFNEVASDADSIDLLRKARIGEREAILQSQRSLLLQAQAAGMSAEQAKEAAKMLNKMVAAKPIDRIKQAARLRVMGAAMGIQGASEAADTLMAGPRAAKDKKRQEQLMGVMEQMATKGNEMAQQGMSQEILFSKLAEGLHLDEYLGKGSPFSTSLADSLKPQIGDLQKTFIDTAETTSGKLFGQLVKSYDQLTVIASGAHYLGPILAGVASIAAMMVGGKTFGAISKGIGKLFGGSRAAGAAAGEVGEVATGGASLLSKAGTVAKVAGKYTGAAGAMLDAGMGVYDLSQGKEQTGMSGTDWISPMRWGMLAGHGINKGAEWLANQTIGASSIGTSIAGATNADRHTEIEAMLKGPAPSARQAKPTTANASKLTDATKETAKTSSVIKEATQATAAGVTEQVKKLDASNDLLKKLVDASDKHTELMEKQLVAMTMTDREKGDSKTLTDLRKNNKFAASYGYV